MILENDNTALREALSTRPNPNADTIVNPFNVGWQVGFDKSEIIRHNLGEDRHIDVYHSRTFLKIHGSSRLNIQPQASNLFHVEVE